MREHRVTHPTFGVVTWFEIKAGTASLTKSLKKRICSWCLKEVHGSRRTRCGSKECDEALHRAQRYSYCRGIQLREHRFCECGVRGSEVDHVVPVSLGGTGDKSNLRTLCRACHKVATALLRAMKSKYKAI